MTLRKLQNTGFMLLPVMLTGLFFAFKFHGHNEFLFKLSVCLFFVPFVAMSYLKAKYLYCPNCGGSLLKRLGKHCRHCGCKIDYNKKL